MIFWLCLMLVMVPLLVEGRRMKSWRSRVPFRVHVHGSRGKSAAVREMTRLLRDRGFRVLGKTTGDAPEYLLPDGTVVPIRRIGPASIREHVAVLRKAAALKVDVVVAEGMALQPETVFMSERILHATHAVITNVRPDHAETMGRGRSGVVQTLSLLIPDNGLLFTARENGAEQLKRQARNAGTECRIIDAALHAPFQPHALARAVTESIAGADNGTAPVSAPPSRDEHDTEESLTAIRSLSVDGLPVLTADLFSANDVLSSRLLLHRCRPWKDTTLFRAALLSARADRPLRSTAFLDWLLGEPRFDLIVAAGDHAPFALLWGRMRRRRAGRPAPPCMLAGKTGNEAPARLMTTLAALAVSHGRSGLFVAGLGNAHGYAERWRAVYGGPPCS